MQRYVFATDLHWGFEYDGQRKRRPIHDLRALAVLLAFLEDFQPDHVILGGDMLDCGPISHHNLKEGPATHEGLRIATDAAGLRANLLDSLESSTAKLTYIIGNHELFLDRLVTKFPGLQGYIEAPAVLGLGKRWELVPQGGHKNLGKLTFMHGDQLGYSEHLAKKAVLEYERCIRFGHVHTHQTFTKVSAHDIDDKRTGVAVPCLCNQNPGYQRSRPNRWVHGFNYGWVRKDGTFSDYVAIITGGKAVINGVEYRG